MGGFHAVEENFADLEPAGGNVRENAGAGLGPHTHPLGEPYGDLTKTYHGSGFCQPGRQCAILKIQSGSFLIPLKANE